MKTPAVTVIPLGPGSPELMTLQTVQLLQSGQRLILRTARHPAAAWLDSQRIEWSSLDALYDSADSFDDLQNDISAYLLNQASDSPLLYAVPDPLSDRSVSALRRMAADRRLAVRVLPGVSVSNLCLTACESGMEPYPVQLISASDFSSQYMNPEISLLITEIDTRVLAGEIKLKLNDLLDDEIPVYFFPPSESSERHVCRIPLLELDRRKSYDHTAAVYVPGTGYQQRSRFVFQDLVRIMDRLRARDGCPWDREQTHASLRPYLVEEAWEAVDAIDEGDVDHLADELGDVLLQVVFHASIAQSYDEFSMSDVITHICAKMIQRHPRLFTEKTGSGLTGVSSGDTWETLKRAETGSRTVGESLNDVSSSLPALKYAIKICKKLAQLSASRRTPEETAAEISELSGRLLAESGSLREDVMGRLLIRCMELCRLKDVDGEILLHAAVRKLKARYQAAEKAVLRDKKAPESLTFEQLCVYLNQVEGEIE